jgi:hypothetical protein
MRRETALIIKIYVIVSVVLVLAVFAETRKEGQSDSISVDPLFGTTCYVEMYKEGKFLGNGTGFFFYF